MPFNPLAALRFATSPDCALTTSQRMIYLVLVRMADDQGTCWPSIATIGDCAGCKKRTVKRSLFELNELGHVYTQPHVGRGNSYHLAALEFAPVGETRPPVNLAPVKPDPRANNTPPPGQIGPGGMPKIHRGGAKNVPRSTLRSTQSTTQETKTRDPGPNKEGDRKRSTADTQRLQDQLRSQSWSADLAAQSDYVSGLLGLHGGTSTHLMATMVATAQTKIMGERIDANGDMTLGEVATRIRQVCSWAWVRKSADKDRRIAKAADREAKHANGRPYLAPKASERIDLSKAPTSFLEALSGLSGGKG